MRHPDAIIDPKASIDPTAEIGPFCVIGPNVKIGPRCRLISHVVVDGLTEIGADNTFFPFGVVGMIPQDLKYHGENTKLVIGEKNTFRESVTLNLGTAQGGGVTKIGNSNLLMAYVHVGHDCRIGDNCILANSVQLAGHVTVCDYANIGGMVGVGQFLRVGSHCYVTGQAGVEREVPPFCIASGTRPFEIRGVNIVGLRRRGFDPQTIQTLSEAVKLWMRPDVPKERCLIEIETQYGENIPIKEFVGFIRESRAGVAK